jgi:hypothetical protein
LEKYLSVRVRTYCCFSAGSDSRGLFIEGLRGRIAR